MKRTPQAWNCHEKTIQIKIDSKNKIFAHFFFVGAVLWDFLEEEKIENSKFTAAPAVRAARATLERGTIEKLNEKETESGHEIFEKKREMVLWLIGSGEEVPNLVLAEIRSNVPSPFLKLGSDPQPHNLQTRNENVEPLFRIV